MESANQRNLATELLTRDTVDIKDVWKIVYCGAE